MITNENSICNQFNIITQSCECEITSSQRNIKGNKKTNRHPVIVQQGLGIWVSVWFPVFVFIHLSMGQGKGGAKIQSGTWASKVGVLSVLIKHPTWLRQPCQTTRLGPRSAVQKSHRCAAGSRAPSPTEDPGSDFGFAAFDERVGAAAGAAAQ